MPAAPLSRWTGYARQRMQPWSRSWSARRIRVFWVVSRVLLIVLAVVGRTLGAQHGVLGDVRLYDHWGHGLVHGAGLPVDDDRWQYPPAAAIVLAVPSALEAVIRLPYEVGFFLMILAADAAVTGMLARRSASAARFWLLGICALGPVSLARFDLIPAVLAVAALVGVAHRRWGRVGLAVGLGTLVKVWPVLLLPALGAAGSNGPTPDAHPDPGTHPALPAACATPAASRPALARLAGGLVAAAVLVAAVLFAAGWWRDSFGFLGAQKARGLQTEAVPATPFVLAHMVGLGPGPVYDWGSFQFGSQAARIVATACSLVEIVVVLGATVWWWIPRSSRAATDPAGRMLALLLVVIVTSRVLSPQYLVWLLAVAACCPLWPGPATGTGAPVDSSDTCPTRPARPAPSHRWITVGLLVICLISFVVYPIRYDDVLAGRVVASLLLVVRNLLLLIVCWVAVGEVSRVSRPAPSRPRRQPRRPRSRTRVQPPGPAGSTSEPATPVTSYTAPPT